MKTFATIITIILSIALLIGLSFGSEVLSLKWKAYFAPRHENVNRQVFKQTKSYNEGKAQELIKYRLEYLRTKDNDEKMAIASTIRMSFSDYTNVDSLPYELQQFLKEVLY